MRLSPNLSALALSWVLVPSALAAIQPRASPVCSFTCNPTPPSTAPGGQFLDQTTSGPFIECDYFTTDLYGTGPSDYGCLYTSDGVRHFFSPEIPYNHL